MALLRGVHETMERKDMALEVYLVRHGKTVFNTTGRLQGWSDSPLTQEGKQVAEALGRALKGKVCFDAAFSSVSPRAVETAKLILAHQGQAHLPLQMIEELREYGFGSFEGEFVKTVHDMVARQRGFADIEAWLAAYHHAESHLLAESISALDPMGLAETEEQFFGRLRRGLTILTDIAPKQGKVLLVSHGMTITGILKIINPQSTLYKSVENATVSHLKFENYRWTVEKAGKRLS